MTSNAKSAAQRLAERIRASTGIDDARILQAFSNVPRHEFLSEAQLPSAYDDRALPLDDGQTISQPSMIAIMLKELECQPGQRALEVGAGSGYAAAVLGQLVAEVYTVEVRPALTERARQNVERSGARNVHVVQGDGSRGLAAHAPYDRILVSAAPSRVPGALVEQLAEGGRIAIPVGDEHGQTLLVGRKTGPNTLDWQKTVPCIFVPLVTS
jgi:protein-L-isoaspartate(D-aspartate) O-methyltransferase